ncbi:MAG: ATP-binding protein [Candidatus Paceibacterota bacterium]|jgi:signal transduction histidine kinase
MNSTNISLTILNVAYAFSFVLTLIFGFAVYLKGRHKTLHVIFLFLSISVATFQITHILGINAPDPEVSRSILMGDLSVFFIAAFLVHWILATLGKDQKRSGILVGLYSVVAGFILYFMANPSAFLHPSIPKLYLPNYYQPGFLYWAMVAFFMLCGAYCLFEVILSYRKAEPLERESLLYYIWAIAIGLPLGSVSFVLVFDIPLDPLYAIPFSLYVLPLAYGIIRSDIMEVKVVAKKSLVYGVLVAVGGLLIAGINSAQDIAATAYPWMPSWALPIVSSMIAVLVGGFVWEKTRDIDVLKYEFITIVTHKFRTPLTRIRWASEMLKKSIAGKGGDEDAAAALEEIDSANELLVELTDTLVSLKQSDEAHYSYSPERVDMCSVLDRAASSLQKLVRDKNISLSATCPQNLPFVSIDLRRMNFAFQTVVENSLMYTPAGGSISFSAEQDGRFIVVRIRDTGIGISKEDMSRIFSKFFRSKQAKTSDTEGMGVGLFMARQIIERHGGTIQAVSEGLGKGAEFIVRLPVAEEVP